MALHRPSAMKTRKLLCSQKHPSSIFLPFPRQSCVRWGCPICKQSRQAFSSYAGPTARIGRDSDAIHESCWGGQRERKVEEGQRQKRKEREARQRQVQRTTQQAGWVYHFWWTKCITNTDNRLCSLQNDPHHKLGASVPFHPPSQLQKKECWNDRRTLTPYGKSWQRDAERFTKGHFGHPDPQRH